MPPRSSRPTSREEIILTLYEARRLAETTVADAPEYKRGFMEGIEVAIEILRAYDGLSRAIDDRPVERRA